MSIDKLKEKIKIKRKINTYTEMWDCSLYLLEKGQKEKKGSYYQFMASLIFTAFTLESYYNHAGEKIFACWNKIERSLSHTTKLILICDNLNIKIEDSKRPYQTIRQLFSFRDKIAHGKDINLEPVDKIQFMSDKYENDFVLKAEWQTFCTEKNAIQSKEDAEQIIRNIHSKIATVEDPVFFRGMEIQSSTILPNSP